MITKLIILLITYKLFVPLTYADNAVIFDVNGVSHIQTTIENNGATVYTLDGAYEGTSIRSGSTTNFYGLDGTIINVNEQVGN